MQNSDSSGGIQPPFSLPVASADLEGTYKTLEELLTRVRGERPLGSEPLRPGYVFVVHGRDKQLRESMFAFLRALCLNPKGWAEAVHDSREANPGTHDIIEAAMARAQAIVVLFSPDEHVRLKDHHRSDGDHDSGVAGQPRPNVIYEAGYARGSHPLKTVLVQVGKMRPFSDIAGKDILMLTDVASRNDLANRLANIGCPVSKIGNDWMTVGDFRPTEGRARKSNVRAGAANSRR